MGIRSILPLDLVRFVLNIGVYVGLGDSRKATVRAFVVGIRCILDITMHGQMVGVGHADDRGLTRCRFTRKDLSFIYFPYVVDIGNIFLQSASHRVSIRILAENIIDRRSVIQCRPEAKGKANSR